MTLHGSFDTRPIDPVLVEADFFETGDFQALPSFDDLYEVGRGSQVFMTSGIKPCSTTTEQFDGQLVQFEIGSV